MKEMSGKIEYKGKEYTLAFNLNVMEIIQDEYGTVEKWGELTSGTAKGKTKGEPNAKAVIFGFGAMLNEGIDIENENNGTDIKPFTPKQVGRMLSEIGFENAADILKNTVVESTQSAEKNA